MAQLLSRASAIWQHLPGLSDNYRPGLYFSSLSQSHHPLEHFFLIILKFLFISLVLAVLSVACCLSLVVVYRLLTAVTSLLAEHQL